jgi:hypothetical protein
MAVNKELADKIRIVAKKIGSTTREVTDQLLDYALKNAELKVEVKTVNYRVPDLLKGKR